MSLIKAINKNTNVKSVVKSIIPDVGPTNDINKELKRLRSSSKYGKFYQPLFNRQWISSKGSSENTSNTCQSFSFMQFNILADGLCGIYHGGKKNFPNIPFDALKFEYRGFRIIEEILKCKPDIICLEEVDRFDFMQYYLQPFGYHGLFHPKGNSPCVRLGKSNGYELPSDGVAVFYKTNKFELATNDVHTFGLNGNVGKAPLDMVAMLVHFRFLNSSKMDSESNVDESKVNEQQKNVVCSEFLVGVTHLKASKDSKGENVRLKQLQYWLPACKRIRNGLKMKSNAINIPIFIGCDLNSPNINSCGFAPMAYHSIVDGIHFREQFNDDGINIPDEYENGYGLNLVSAYRVSSVNSCEPVFTTYKLQSGKSKSGENRLSRHTIDYIFFDDEFEGKVSHQWSIPREDEIDKNVLIPAWNYPSDHFAIAVQFRL